MKGISNPLWKTEFIVTCHKSNKCSFSGESWVYQLLRTFFFFSPYCLECLESWCMPTLQARSAISSSRERPFCWWMRRKAKVFTTLDNKYVSFLGPVFNGFHTVFARTQYQDISTWTSSNGTFAYEFPSKKKDENTNIRYLFVTKVFLAFDLLFRSFTHLLVYLTKRKDIKYQMPSNVEWKIFSTKKRRKLTLKISRSSGSTRLPSVRSSFFVFPPFFVCFVRSKFLSWMLLLAIACATFTLKSLTDSWYFQCHDSYWCDGLLLRCVTYVT